MTSRAPLGRVWAVVPVKRFDQAKQRLSGVLDSAARAALAAAMLSDVLEQLSGTAGLASVLVVTSDTGGDGDRRKFRSCCADRSSR